MAKCRNSRCDQLILYNYFPVEKRTAGWDISRVVAQHLQKNFHDGYMLTVRESSQQIMVEVENAINIQMFGKRRVDEVPYETERKLLHLSSTIGRSLV